MNSKVLLMPSANTTEQTLFDVPYEASVYNRYLAQRLVVAATHKLMRAASGCPSRWQHPTAHNAYQTEVMQPLRDRLGIEADRLDMVGGRLW